MMRLILAIIMLMMLGGLGYAVTIYIAPVQCYTEAGARKSELNFQELVLNRLEVLCNWETLDFKALDSMVAVPVSFLDALRLCTESKLDYLLYGYIEEKEFALYGELKLFDRAKQAIVQVFYGGDNRGQELRLADDLAAKLGAYFKGLFGADVSITEQQPVAEKVMGLAAGGGYWTPLAAEERGYLQPLYNAGLAFTVVPWRPAMGRRLVRCYFKTGISCDFYLSCNKAGYERFDVYALTAGIPVYVCLDAGRWHTVSLGVEPLVAVDYLVREPLYAEPVAAVHWCFAARGGLGYQFHFSKYLAVNLENRFVVQFTEPVRLTYNIALLLELNFTGAKK